MDTERLRTLAAELGDLKNRKFVVRQTTGDVPGIASGGRSERLIGEPGYTASDYRRESLTPRFTLVMEPDLAFRPEEDRGRLEDLARRLTLVTQIYLSARTAKLEAEIQRIVSGAIADAEATAAAPAPPGD